MTTSDAQRKRFRRALGIAGLTSGEWCAQEGVTYQHVWAVLTGRRTSAPLQERIDRFIESQFARLQPAA